jgi:hypothetical protein
MVVEGLKIKPIYLEMQVMQVDITFCVISNQLMEIWKKSCSTNK